MNTKNENIQLLKNDLTSETFEEYSLCDLIAVDCEMMGLNPVRDRLCLVQMCNEKEKVTLVKIEPDKKAPNLKNLFENPEIKKIFHFGRTDLAFLYYRLGIDLKNIFCTKIASRLTRTFTDKHGLKDLVKEFFNVNLDKNTQTTDWGHDELTNDQIKYAAKDVTFLIPLYRKFLELLKREHRMELAEKANGFLPTLAKLDLLGYQDFFAH